MFTDLFIESVLTAGLKSTGGLTRGLGFNESTRLLFLLSRPIGAEISQSIFEIAMLAPRIQRDMSDIDKSFWNVECSALAQEGLLVSLLD